MKPQRRRSTLLNIGLGCAGAILLLGLLGLYYVSRGHIPEYLVWRWMVTTRQPITPVDDFHIVVQKGLHLLTVYRGEVPVRNYRVAISKHGPAPRKIWEDELTPEGTFRIASMQYTSAYGPRQMLLDTTQQSLADYRKQYGTEGTVRLEQWQMDHGLLDTIWEVYDFNEDNPQFPIWNDILIHGGGSGRDWTWGCIALDDADVIELFDILKQSKAGGLGVSVEILP